ncbi:hypothetical protein EV356DRAFT_531116 [Viridothelium virens]|uniref:Extracellular membrane protein CFEM domain-containing protein n=1 Tax=Viridothelium virens TaxID=1048519 RepID=A0A6A6HFD8_VIRVR|nr:hypothetical protein EV356DRAFT_531116 [Viridothelium virens]
MTRSSPRYAHGHAAFILIPLFSSLGACVSLSDFNPKLSNLPSNCNSVYTQSISGCTTSDFSGGNPCSDLCANALMDLTSKIDSACASAQLPGGDIISAFKNGGGVKALCPNIGSSQSSTANGGGGGAGAATSAGGNGPSFVSTVSFTSTLSPPTTPSSTTSSSTSSTSSTSTLTSTSTTLSTTSSTSSTSSSSSMSVSTAPTITSAMSSIAMDTTAAPALNPSQSASLESMMSSLTSAAPPIRTSDSSDRSGGGSPFDISAAHSVRPRTTMTVAVVVSAMLVGVVLGGV